MGNQQRKSPIFLGLNEPVNETALVKNLPSFDGVYWNSIFGPGNAVLDLNNIKLGILKKLTRKCFCLNWDIIQPGIQ